jgi:hypothetical protein
MSQQPPGSFSVKSSHPFVNPTPNVDQGANKRPRPKGKRQEQGPQSNLTSTHSGTGHAIRQVHSNVEDFY